MKIWHCNNCHHEWEGNEKKNKCSWCYGYGRIIGETPSIPLFLVEKLIKGDDK